MTIYPQLSTGTACQYPIARTIVYRTITNSLEDGSRITLADANATRINWSLTYSGITNAELSELRVFFEGVEGRLNVFTFLDPAANLLVWSESLGNAAWQANSLLGLQAGTPDPLGTQRATRVTNSTQGSLTLVQNIPVPASLAYCWSGYFRSAATSILLLTNDTTTVQHVVTTSWRRISLSSPATGDSDSSNFGMSIPPGADIEVFGLQVMAQRNPSKYTSTLNVSGVYPETRFDSDALISTAEAPNSNTCQVTLYSRTS
jgi:hypothetical protein